MSLRVKFLALLVVVPSLGLGLFLYFAATTFISDKTSYLLESQFQLLNSTSLIFLEDQSTHALSESGGEETQKPSDKQLDFFQRKVAQLVRQEGFESLLVLNDKGQVIEALNESDKNQSLKDILGNNVFDKLMNQTSSEGGFEAFDKSNETRIVSFIRLQINSEPKIFVLHSLKANAIRASLIFLLKSLSTFGALIAFSVLISIIFSNKLTRGLRTLSKAMTEFGKGKNDSPLPPASSDEVGEMSQQFGDMRVQIGYLLVEKENKAKIEAEMRLAGQLQKRFFPQDHFSNKNIDLTGYFEPAHDAGGDWWFYFEKDKKFIFLIGDVTGHGLNSAMMTGVSRSAFSLIEDLYQSPSESLRLLNRAVYDTALGELNMTCFVGSLDMETGLLTYANASHEAPYVIPPLEKSLKIKDLNFLNGDGGLRLGQQKDAEYPENTFQLSSDMMVFLYTDGLTELKNASDEMLGERKLISGIGTNHNLQVSTQNMIQKVKSVVSVHRQNCDLNDDLSFMAIQWRRS